MLKIPETYVEVGKLQKKMYGRNSKQENKSMNSTSAFIQLHKSLTASIKKMQK